VNCRLHHTKSRGFTLLELALILVLLGSALVVVMHYRPTILGQQSAVAEGYQDQITAAVFRYALRHYRLPCADTNGNGLEGDSSGVCGSSGKTVGGVPFVTLNMTDSTALSDDVRQSYIYGVFRGSTTATDLATLAERTGDSIGDSQYLSLDDLRFALRTLASQGLDASRIHVTGDGLQAGSADCSTNRISNLAFFVVYSGSLDADQNGNPFDGVHNQLTWPSGGSRCVSGPETPESEQYDDSVIAVGFAELLGYLTQ